MWNTMDGCSVFYLIFFLPQHLYNMQKSPEFKLAWRYGIFMLSVVVFIVYRKNVITHETVNCGLFNTCFDALWFDLHTVRKFEPPLSQIAYGVTFLLISSKWLSSWISFLTVSDTDTFDRTTKRYSAYRFRRCCCCGDNVYNEIENQNRYAATRIYKTVCLVVTLIRMNWLDGVLCTFSTWYFFAFLVVGRVPQSKAH